MLPVVGRLGLKRHYLLLCVWTLSESTPSRTLVPQCPGCPRSLTTASIAGTAAQSGRPIFSTSIGPQWSPLTLQVSGSGPRLPRLARARAAFKSLRCQWICMAAAAAAGPGRRLRGSQSQDPGDDEGPLPTRTIWVPRCRRQSRARGPAPAVKVS